MASQAGLFDPATSLDPQPEPPAEETRQRMIQAAPETRAQFVLDLTIYSDEFTQAMACATTIMSRARKTSLPGGAIITGEGGTGKSFIKERLLRRYPAKHGRTTSFVPAVAIELDSTPSVEGVKVSILHALGHTNASQRLTAKEREDDVVTALEACRSHVLIVDEAHHMQLSSGTRKNKDRPAGPVGDFFKVLYGRVRIPFLFMGKPGLGTLFDEDAQLSSRWPGRIALSQFPNDENWIALLESLDEALPMRERSNLFHAPAARALHAFTQGNFRRLKFFLSEAVRQAAIDQATMLDMACMRRTYYLLGLPHPNPFGPYDPCLP